MSKEDDSELSVLLEMLKSESTGERAEAAKSLGVLADSGAEKYLIKALKDEDEIVRSNAALALSQISDNAKILLDTLQDDSWLVRHDGVIALGHMGSSELIDNIIPLTKDEVPDVREQAIRTLAKIDGKKALKVILEYMEEEGLKLEVAEALDILGIEEAIEPLIKLYRNGSQHIREIAVKAMGTYQSEEVVDTLIKALKDNSWRIREEAADALGSLEHERSLPALYKMLDDDNNYVIEKALKGIGKLGDQSDVERIKMMLEHDEATVRAAASEALGTLGGESTIEVLISALYKERNPMVVWAISDAISEAASRTQDSLLKEEIKKAPEYYVCVLAVALGNTGETNAIDELLKGMVHSSWKFRQKSVESIFNMEVSKLNDTKLKKLVRTLSKALTDTDRWVRSSAAEVMGFLANVKELEGYKEEIENSLSNRLKRESDEDVIEALKRSIG